MRVLCLAAALAAAVALVPSPAVSQPHKGTEWKEVFSPDGRITRVRVPVVVEPQVGVQDVAIAAVEPIQETGPAANRFDMVIVGDGYTASEQGLLRQHAVAKWNEISATAPWDKHKGSINVWLVGVVSNQSGVDNDPTQGVSRDTALDMGFWCFNIERLLCVNESKAKSYAAQAPGVDAIVAVGNSTKYGGAGYPSLSTVSGGNAQSAQVAIHELGHSVGGLADEYWTAGTTYTGTEPREPNVTKDPSGAKWSSYLGKPTPDGGTIGAYQGGHQYERGIYRPSQDSLMRTLGKPFNSVSLDVMDRAIRSKISTTPTGCTSYPTTRTGSLNAGASAHQPDGSYFQAAAGSHRACLDGPTGANFDLALQKWNGSAWATVASATTSSPDETLTYTGTSGYYTYRITAVTGSGSYTLGYGAP
ncbi:M64 family metallopeptidase [Actinokineospora soli]|uniref:M64 family metallopeptidase n=1 Tax=Actinokineospora soli TaxID=1048753 RepID=A0ABW2TWD3_9PSEU